MKTKKLDFLMFEYDENRENPNKYCTRFRTSPYVNYLWFTRREAVAFAKFVLKTEEERRKQ